MNINDSSITTQRDSSRRDDQGFTLIEILLAIVLVGILAAVAVVGISNLVDKGGDSACEASRDSARAATAVFFASNNRYPTNFKELTEAPVGADAAYTLPSDASIEGDSTVIKNGNNWTLTMTPGVGNAAPNYDCS